jgi:hypothetical protein
VDAVERVFLALEDIERTRAERIVETRRHAAIVGAVFGELGLAGDHLVRRRPFRPLPLVLDFAAPGPGEARAAEADAVAHGLAVGIGEIEEVAAGIDHQRARRLAGRVGHHLAVEFGVDLVVRNGGQRELLVGFRRIEQRALGAACIHDADRPRRDRLARRRGTSGQTRHRRATHTQQECPPTNP